VGGGEPVAMSGSCQGRGLAGAVRDPGQWAGGPVASRGAVGGGLGPSGTWPVGRWRRRGDW